MGSLVYFIRHGNDPLIKIGTTKDLHTRLADLQCGAPKKLSVIVTLSGGDVLERRLHRIFRKQRKRGEWFYLDCDLSRFVESIIKDPDQSECLIQSMEEAGRESRTSAAKRTEWLQSVFPQALAADIAGMAENLGRKKLAQIAGVTEPTISNSINQKHIISAISMLRIWEFDKEALPSVRSLIGLTLGPIDHDSKPPEKAGAIDCLGSLADMLRNRRDEIRTEAPDLKVA